MKADWAVGKYERAGCRRDQNVGWRRAGAGSGPRAALLHA